MVQNSVSYCCFAASDFKIVTEGSLLLSDSADACLCMK